VEGVRTLTSVYKQIQDSFAEQIVIYLQAAWRRHKAKKAARSGINQLSQEKAPARTMTPDSEFDAITSTPADDDGRLADYLASA